MPASNLKVGIASVLKQEGFIAEFDKIDNGREGVLRIQLKYGPFGEPVISVIRRESKAGRRDYRGARELPRVLNGLGIAIVSTSQGVLSDRECKERNIGGELICTVS